MRLPSLSGATYGEGENAVSVAVAVARVCVAAAVARRPHENWSFAIATLFGKINENNTSQ